MRGTAASTLNYKRGGKARLARGKARLARKATLVLLRNCC